jgi:subtilisin family serine protease
MPIVFLPQQDTRTRPDLPKLDLHVLPLYKMGVTGRGVRVAVLDDGIEYTHDDIRENYVSFCFYSLVIQYRILNAKLTNIRNHKFNLEASYIVRVRIL